VLFATADALIAKFQTPSQTTTEKVAGVENRRSIPTPFDLCREVSNSWSLDAPRQQQPIIKYFSIKTLILFNIY
jgi:hypothetical protein